MIKQNKEANAAKNELSIPYIQAALDKSTDNKMRANLMNVFNTALEKGVITGDYGSTPTETVPSDALEKIYARVIYQLRISL